MKDTRSTMIVIGMAGINIGVLMTLGMGAFAEDSELDTGPRVIPYNGVLEFNGQGFNGAADIQFTLSTEGGCSEEFVEHHEDVPVYAGRFSVNIGAGANAEGLATADLPGCLFDAQAVYLQMAVRGGEDEDPHIALAGRQRINPVPFAYWSAEGSDLRINGAVTSEAVVTDNATVTQNITAASLNAGSFYATGADIGFSNSPGRGDGGRVIVHDVNDALTINYGNDFSSTKIEGAVNVTGHLTSNTANVTGNITAGTATVNGATTINGATIVNNNTTVNGNASVNGTFSTGTINSSNITSSGGTGQTANINIVGNNNFATLDASARLNLSLPGHTGFELAAGDPAGEFDLLFFQRRGGPNALIMRLSENGYLSPSGGVTTPNMVASRQMRMPTGATPPHGCDGNHIGAMYVDTSGQSWGHAVCICVQQDDNAPYWTRADNFSDRNGCGY